MYLVEQRLQAHARNLVGSLYMMVRSTQLYDADNQIFDRPLELAGDEERRLGRRIDALRTDEARHPDVRWWASAGGIEKRGGRLEALGRGRIART